MTDTLLLLVSADTLPLLASGHKLLGLRYTDRIFLPAHRCGFKRFALAVLGDAPAPSLAPHGFHQIPLDQLPEEFLVLSPRALFLLSGWEKIAAQKPQAESIRLAPGAEGCFLVGSRERGFILDALKKSRSERDFGQALKDKLKCEPLPLAEKEVCLCLPGEKKRIESWLLRSLIKDNEGFMSRHFERKISISTSRLLVWTPLTPNGMTVISSAIGIFGGFLFTGGEAAQHTAGALLFWLHSVLDGCDGELARLKFMQSRWGGILDFWGDNVVHSVVFAAIAAGAAAKLGTPSAFLLGALAVGGTLLSAGYVYAKTMQPKPGLGPLFTSVIGAAESRANAVEKAADFLARRDFIYLVILLAAFGKIEWFLILGAIGSPVYFLVLLIANRKSPPHPIPLP